MTKKDNFKDIITFGFALFAMFFGAGNLIFPPYLGIISGPSWFVAFAGFTIADAGLALLAIIAIALCEGDIMKLFEKIGKGPAILLSFADIMCVGPLLVIPRTGATTYEMGITPILGQNTPILLVVAVFFALTFVLTVRPSKVIDIVGQVLTPFLIIALLVIIVKGVISPLGQPVAKPMIANIFQRGITDGYQTMDCFVPLAVGAVLILTLREKGYTEPKDQVSLLIKAGIVACIGLGVIYGGLTYLGSTVSTMYGVDAQKSQVIVNITQMLLGNSGKTVLSVAVSLACLTTSIGLTSASAEYLSSLTKNKVSYPVFVAIICVFSAGAATIGVAGLVMIANPILAIVYPPTIVLIVLTIARSKVKNPNVYRFAAYLTLIISILTLVSTKVPALDFINKLPLANLGFNWVIPAIIAGLIGSLVGRKKLA